nr:hypothetical protein B7L52_21190 [Pectobacterium carotovorum]
MPLTWIMPAGFASRRLAGKPLADVNGKPMVGHVRERALDSGAQRDIVATGQPDVGAAVQQAGGEVCLTRARVRHTSPPACCTAAPTSG